LPIGFFRAEAVTHFLHKKSAVADRTKVAASSAADGI